MNKALTKKEQKKRLLVLDKETLRKLQVTGGSRIHIPVGLADDTSTCDSDACSA
jgi:hypothetical protein